MSICVDKQHLHFKLDTLNNTYLVGVTDTGHFINYYYGKKISDIEISSLVPLFWQTCECTIQTMGGTEKSGWLPHEYGCWGKGDYRTPAVELVLNNGDRTLDLRYASHQVYKGKYTTSDGPHLFLHDDSEADTLEVLLKDTGSQVEIKLFYCVFSKIDAIVRRVEIKNAGEKSISVEKIMSASFPLWGQEYDFVHLGGAWAREQHVERMKLGQTKISIGSSRGIPGFGQNPFAAIVSQDCTERSGKAYGVNLVYSGNFIIEVQGDRYDELRINAGINPEGFSWLLEADEVFITPECVMVYSDQGIGGMSRIYHKLYRKHLISQKWQNTKRPIILNSWEAAYFDFDGDKLIQMAKEAAGMNIDLLVMDDGWFGHRNDDTTSLGDWTPNENKLGYSLNDLTENVKQQKMDFGIWIEPEMISEDSELYRKHPEWCLQTNRVKTASRHQYVLDFSREEVLEYIENAITKVLTSADFKYVKWDMNRSLTDAYSAALPPEREGEVLHRYICNVYRLTEFLISRFPDILFQGCAGGGARFDPGQLYYTPIIWTSDNMDPIERMKIQYGTSMVYPPSSMVCHVCSETNKITNRVLPLKTRGECAMMGGEFGYELDITKLAIEERNTIKKQIAIYKSIRELIFEGDYYRLADPFQNNYAAWMFVSEDKARCVMTYIQTLSEPNGNPHRVFFDGLEPNALYQEEDTKMQYYGDTLMNVGLLIPIQKGDFKSEMYIFSRVK